MLSNRDVAHRANLVADDASRLCSALMSGTLQRMADHTEGISAARWDGSTSGGISDPTATIALNRRSGDLATRQRIEIERAVLRAQEALRHALKLAALYPESHGADPAVMAALGRDNTPGCDSCGRLEVAPGVKRWEPIDYRLASPTTAGGRLAEAVWLCSWCHNRVRLWRRLPTLIEVERHHQGRRVAWPADVPRPREANA